MAKNPNWANAPKNTVKENFHNIVSQKMVTGMSGHQAVASTYAKAFPGSTVYRTPNLASKAQRDSLGGLQNIRPKKPKAY